MAGEVVAATSIITSRCGSATLMGLGVAVVGLILASVVVVSGQLWTVHQALQDALDNAVWALEEAATGPKSASELGLLVSKDGGFSAVDVLSFQDRQGTITAKVSAPITLGIWPVWLGARPLAVTAAT